MECGYCEERIVKSESTWSSNLQSYICRDCKFTIERQKKRNRKRDDFDECYDVSELDF